MRTNEEIAEMREEMLEAHEGFHHWQDNAPEYETPFITCDGCPHKYTCDLAYDLYNTDGDCLEQHLAATPNN